MTEQGLSTIDPGKQLHIPHMYSYRSVRLYCMLKGSLLSHAISVGGLFSDPRFSHQMQDFVFRSEWVQKRTRKRERERKEERGDAASCILWDLAAEYRIAYGERHGRQAFFNA